jgi:hypothetical protein
LPKAAAGPERYVIVPRNQKAEATGKQHMPFNQKTETNGSLNMQQSLMSA